MFDGNDQYTIIGRDAGTGRFVPTDYAKKNPKTTVVEKLRKVKGSYLKNNTILDKSLNKIEERLKAMARSQKRNRQFYHTLKVRDSFIKISSSVLFLGDIIQL